MENLISLFKSTGMYSVTPGQAAMLAVGLLLIWLAIKKGFEPLLLLPIGFGCVLSNIPLAGISAHEGDYLPTRNIVQVSYADSGEQAAQGTAGIVQSILVEVDQHIEQGQVLMTVMSEGETVEVKATQSGKIVELPVQAGDAVSDPKASLAVINLQPLAEETGFLGQFYSFGIATGLFPLMIFMGVGAMTDFGPLIANPRTALLGAAAQFGIFTTLIGALLLSKYFTGINFDIKDASAIGIIGGADGPTAIYLTSKLSPRLLGSIAVAAYSYMALVPLIQPPIMRMLTTKKERMIEMKQLRHVTKAEKIVFPLLVLGLCAILLPSACPLIGALMFGNLVKESGVVERLSKTLQNELINIVTIMLGLAVGSKLAAERFLNWETLGILILGMVAFGIGTGAGVVLAKIMNIFSKNKINPLIGAAGVSAVPMAARVANKVGLEDNPHNFLLMHAMGPNVSGVIGSAVAAGVLLAVCG